MVRIAADILRFASVVVIDLAGLAGAAAFLFGIARLSEPAAWIVGGVMTMTAAGVLNLSSIRRHRQQQDGKR